MDSEFDDVRRDPDPLRRGRRATELLTEYQQRAVELARLRRAAIDEARRVRGMTYTEIASAFGITKGRITQIRNSAPELERVLFGVGPVSVGIPYRYQTTDRERPLIAAEDAKTGEAFEKLLTDLSFAVTRYQIEPELGRPPAGDSVVVCGPKSAPIGANLMAADPMLEVVKEESRWVIREKATGMTYGSPSDEGGGVESDLAYVARHKEDQRVVFHVAGIHAIGSLGAAHFLNTQAGELYERAGDRSFSLIVRCTYRGLDIDGSEVVAGPFMW